MEKNTKSVENVLVNQLKEELYLDQSTINLKGL